MIVAATTAAIGLLLSPSSVPTGNSWIAITALLLYGVSFVAAIVLWLPRKSQRPGKTDVDHIWQYLVGVEDDVSAATLMGDICKATVGERLAANAYCNGFVACMLCGGLSVVFACVYTVMR